MAPVLKVIVGGIVATILIDVLHPVARVDLSELSSFSFGRNDKTAENGQSDEKCFHVCRLFRRCRASFIQEHFVERLK